MKDDFHFSQVSDTVINYFISSGSQNSFSQRKIQATPSDNSKIKQVKYTFLQSLLYEYS